MSGKKSYKFSCANPTCNARDDRPNWGSGRSLPSWVDRAALTVSLLDKPDRHRHLVCHRCGHIATGQSRWPANLVLAGTIVVDGLAASLFDRRVCIAAVDVCF